MENYSDLRINPEFFSSQKIPNYCLTFYLTWTMVCLFVVLAPARQELTLPFKN